MRNSTRHIGCAMMGIAIALLGTPAAQADEASFLAGARALGLQQSDDVLIRTALSACRFLENGELERFAGGPGRREAFGYPNLRRLPQDVEQHIARHLNLEPASIPPPGRDPQPGEGKAHDLLVLSVNEYCPQLAYRLSDPPA
jgi:hypothetical protein